MSAGLGAAFGDETFVNSANRYTGRNIGDILAGPTGGFAQDVLHTGGYTLPRSLAGFGALAVGADETADYLAPSRGDASALRRLIPGQNAPIVQQVINYGMEEAGTVFDWPERGQ